MAPNQPNRSSAWFSGRTRLITAVSVVAVGLAGATAVSANIGILDTATDTAVGDASVTGDLTDPPTNVVDVVLPDATVATTPTSAQLAVPMTSAVQQFAVDVAGTVTVAATAAGLQLDEVAPAAGWTWTLAQSDPAALMVRMTNGVRTFEFTASAAADGTIAAGVNEPIVTSAPAVFDDDDDDDHDDGDDHDDDDDDGDDHDSDDDDSDDEYEGGDDDD